MNIEKHQFNVGDVIRILSVGDWLLNGLSKEEQESILACVGTEMTISEIDQWGGIWVGIGQTVDEAEWATYIGQSFLVEPQRIELIRKKSQEIDTAFKGKPSTVPPAPAAPAPNPRGKKK
jgi:hypothetical protein